jgi:hypothetical protein
LIVRLAVLAVAVLIVVAVAWAVAGAAQRLSVRRPARRAPRSATYEWERRRDQLSRRVKAVPAPEEDREGILGFIESRQGVEAFVEPRTVIHPLSVVLVAHDGEWVRFQLKDDAFVRDLARTRRLPVMDAGKVGYPERMRRYRRKTGELGGDSDGQAPPS